MPRIQLYLDKFETSNSMDISATIVPGFIHEPYSENKAEIEVSLSTFLKTFKFQIDSYDITNCKKNDIKYFVFKDAFFNDVNLRINPADALMISTDLFQTEYDKSTTNYPSGYKENKKFMCHDYVRYLALKLFNTIHAVDFFNNETELLDDIRKQCFETDPTQEELSTMDNIKKIMEDIDAYNDPTNNPLFDVSYCSEATDYNIIHGMSGNIDSNENICKKLLDQIIGTDKTRLAHLTRCSELQSLPLREGDTIIYKMTMHAADGQENLTSVNPIPERVYEIRYVLTNKPCNILRAENELQSYRLYNFKTGREYQETDDINRSVIRHDFALTLPSYMQHLFSLVIDMKVLDPYLFNNLTTDDILGVYMDAMKNNYMLDLNLSKSADAIITIDIDYDFEIYIYDTQNYVETSTLLLNDTSLLTYGPEEETLSNVVNYVPGNEIYYCVNECEEENEDKTTCDCTCKYNNDNVIYL